jgi:hypothetical protein
MVIETSLYYEARSEKHQITLVMLAEVSSELLVLHLFTKTNDLISVK